MCDPLPVHISVASTAQPITIILFYLVSWNLGNFISLDKIIFLFSFFERLRFGRRRYLPMLTLPSLFFIFAPSFNILNVLVWNKVHLDKGILNCLLKSLPDETVSWPGIIKLFPARESLGSDIPPGDRKMANFFLQCNVHKHNESTIKNLNRHFIKVWTFYLFHCSIFFVLVYIFFVSCPSSPEECWASAGNYSNASVK